MIQIGNLVHRVRIFERAAIVVRIVLRAIATGEHQAKPTRFVAQTIVDDVDHARRE